MKGLITSMIWPAECLSIKVLLIQKKWEDALGREAMRQSRADWTRDNGDLVRHWV